MSSKNLALLFLTSLRKDFRFCRNVKNLLVFILCITVVFLLVLVSTSDYEDISGVVTKDNFWYLKYCLIILLIISVECRAIKSINEEINSIERNISNCKKFLNS